MEFVVKNFKENVVNLAHQIGYINIDATNYNEFSMVRKLTVNNYPRFHIYLKIAGDRFIFNLHLDQKKPSYEGSRAHSGEYEGPVVEDEAGRIRELMISGE